MPGSGKWKGRHYETGKPVEVSIVDGWIESVRSIPEEDGLAWISPGWIDLQVNGCIGISLNRSDLTMNEVLKVTRYQWSKGVSMYLPTLIAGRNKKLQPILRTLADVCGSGVPEAGSIGGVHLQVPIIDDFHGLPNTRTVRHATQMVHEYFESLQQAASGHIALLAVVPESDSALALIRYARSRGVIVRTGYMGTTRTEINEAGLPMSNAVSCVTTDPADTMGWYCFGRLSAGSVGYLTLFDMNEENGRVLVVETVVEGRSVYKRSEL